MKVDLKTREISKGRLSLFLDYQLGAAGRYQISLGLYVVAKPRNAVEKDERDQTMRIGERRRSEEYIRCLDGYVPTKQSSLSIKEYCTDIADSKDVDRTRAGWMALAYHLDRSGLGVVKTAKVTVSDCLRFRSYLTSGSLKASSASHIFGLFRAALKQAHHEGILKSDLRGKFDGIRSKPAEIEYLLQDELDRLLATPTKRLISRQVFAVSCMTGMRWSDLKKLEWREVVDLPDGTSEIRFTAQKTDRYMVLPIGTETRAWIGTRPENGGIVFRGLRNGCSVGRHLEDWAKAAGITKHLHFHMGRHTYATLALSNGVDLKTVSEMLGHSSVRMTERYAKVLDESKRRAAGAVRTSAKIEPPLRLVK